MANEPSLSELTSIPSEGALSGLTPRAIISNADTVRQLNDNAKFQAQNDWNRYNGFLDQLNKVYQTNLDTASIDVMPTDREYLQDKAAELFTNIYKDPKAFFSGKGQTEVYKQLADLRRDATKSKNDNIFRDAHEEFLYKYPNANTDANKGKVNEFTNQDLKTRKPFLFDMNPQVDLAALSKSIGDVNGVTVAINATPSENDEFIHSGKVMKFTPYIKAWDAALYSSPDYRKFTTQQLASQPKYIQDEFKKQDGTPDIESFWHHLGVGTFQGETDPTDKTGLTKKDLTIEDKLVANPNYLKSQKLAQEAYKDKQDIALGWAKLGLDKKKGDALIDLWHSKTIGTEGQKNDALNFATNLYNQIKSLGTQTDKDYYVLTPDNIRQLTSEQLRYLGKYSDTTDSNGKRQVGLDPLSLGDNDVVILENGKISVLSNAHLDEATGRWIGKLDNSRTTTLTNVATNRVNEENQLSGGKEVNNYLPIDAFGDESGGAVTGGKKTTTESSGVLEYSKNELLNSGWTPEQIQQAMDAGKLKLTD